MGVGVRGQQGGAGSLGPLHVSAGQTKTKLAVHSEQPVTQGQADAAADGDRRQTNMNMHTCKQTFPEELSDHNTD